MVPGDCYSSYTSPIRPDSLLPCPSCSPSMEAMERTEPARATKRLAAFLLLLLHTLKLWMLMPFEWADMQSDKSSQCSSQSEKILRGGRWSTTLGLRSESPGWEVVIPTRSLPSPDQELVAYYTSVSAFRVIRGWPLEFLSSPWGLSLKNGAQNEPEREALSTVHCLFTRKSADEHDPCENGGASFSLLCFARTGTSTVYVV